MVFDAPISFETGEPVSQIEVRNPRWYVETGTPIAKDGTFPFAAYVVRKKGEVELGKLGCRGCHTRVMPDGSVVKGAQGSFPSIRSIGFEIGAFFAQVKNPPELLANVRLQLKTLWSVPWLSPDPEVRIEQMSIDELPSALKSIPPGVNPRERTNLLYPVQVTDLIGVQDQHYLDHTGLHVHRSIADLMRYAAMNRGAFDGGDAIADFNGFIPADAPRFQKLPDPATQGRYSDEQLYALAFYLYSLAPPPNPNKFDALAAAGQKVFNRAGCALCHAPPLYTNNKLTPAEGFTPPPGAGKNYDIMPNSVGTDPNLALKTRRGTGYYKVPSLKGVWYRGMFGHSGWCATLEDWFDSRRARGDYNPTGFKPYGAKTYAVKGHPFGLDLSDEERKALIAFLKTL